MGQRHPVDIDVLIWNHSFVDKYRYASIWRLCRDPQHLLMINQNTFHMVPCRKRSRGTYWLVVTTGRLFTFTVYRQCSFRFCFDTVDDNR